MGPLRSVSATVASAAGEIAVNIQRGDDTFELVLDVPEGTEAEVAIPSEYADEVHKNGVQVEDTKTQAVVVPARHWEFVAKAQPQ